jgi:DNA-binding NarL/FixJ family response regulator
MTGGKHSHTSGAGSPSKAAHSKVQPARLLIVDDHPLIRLGLSSLLQQDPQFTVVAEASDARSALECLRRFTPDAVILDITLPGGSDGLELIKNMSAESPGTAILVLSVHDENLYAFRALSAGAKGYLMKDATPDLLRKAVQSILNGRITVSEHLSQRLVQRAVRGREGIDPAESLTDRELEILFRIGRGQSSSEVAAGLGIAVKTIETHRANLRRKLLLKSGAELVRYAVAWRHQEGHHPPKNDPAQSFQTSPLNPPEQVLQEA